MKLELGAGKRPTPGYLHCDTQAFAGIDLIAPAWELDLKDESVEEVIALAFMEHLTFAQFVQVLANVRRMLAPGGRFLFDVPNLPVWADYLVRVARGEQVPFTRRHIYKTIYGHQRWPGDEHHSGWDIETLAHALEDADFRDVEYGVEHFLRAGLHRDRFHRPQNAHIYVLARK